MFDVQTSSGCWVREVTMTGPEPDVADETSSRTPPRRQRSVGTHRGRVFRDETDYLDALAEGSFGPFEPADYGEHR